MECPPSPQPSRGPRKGDSLSPVTFSCLRSPGETAMMNARAEGVRAVLDSAASDEAIVARVLAGDRALFEVLMRRHNRRVYRAARSVIRDEAEVEDVMQQAYLSAYTHL